MSSRRAPEHLRRRTLVWALMGLPMVGFLTLPVLFLLLSTNPTQVLSKLGEPVAMDAIRLTGWTSAVSAFISVLFGAPLAYLIAKGRFRGKKLADVMVDLPVVLPPAVAGIALLLAFGRKGPIGGWLEQVGFGISFTAAAVVLAQTFVAAPLFIRSFAGALELVEDDLEDAAMLDGAGPLAVVRHVTFPIAVGGFFSGVALCWARAVGEFGATILFAGNFPGRTQTMPLAIYLGFEVDFESAVALSTVLLGASVFVLALVRILRH